MVQAYFRRALKIVVGIRVVSWLFFMVIDALIVLLVVAVIAIPAQGLLEDTTVGLAPGRNFDLRVVAKLLSRSICWFGAC